MNSVKRTTTSSSCTLAIVLLLASASGCSSNGGGNGPVSIEGYWQLVSTYKASTATTMQIPAGSVVANIHGGIINLYLTNGTTKTCGTGTYTLVGQTITFGGGGSTGSITLTSTTLRVTTTVMGGPPYNDSPGDLADYTRLATFDTSTYGTCQ